MNKVIGLRIDVDTVRGCKLGIAPILDVLKRFNIKASFFIIAGYDNPLRTLPRCISEKGFIGRIFSLKGSLAYGLFSSGNLTFREVVKRIKGEGHEIGLHGYHHFNWQLRLPCWSSERIHSELLQAVECFKKHTGSYPCSFASPGWVAKKEVFLAEEKLDFDYCSDTRGFSPFYPCFDRRSVKVLQIPVTLPTLDELIYLRNPESLKDISVRKGDVYCAHAEFDGMRYIRTFEEFLQKNLKRNYDFVPLSVIKSRVVDAPSCGIVKKTVPGRTNIITCQGEKF